MDAVLTLLGFYLIGLTGYLEVNGWHNVLLFRVPILVSGGLMAIVGLSGMGVLP